MTHTLLITIFIQLCLSSSSTTIILYRNLTDIHYINLTESICFVAGQKQEQEPEFLAPLENHTVTQGRDVYFTCVVNHLSTYKVTF